jgi:colanic acid/amylovoran biosynthesis protein
VRVATTGAALSGNKGAASMIEALARWTETTGSQLSLLTTYPDDDRTLAPSGVDVIALTPIGLVVRDLPLAVLSRLLPSRVRLWVVRRSDALVAIRDADVVADISGVSFSDDRGPKFNTYNAILTVLPLLLGTPLVKCSQALGPFRQRSNRLFARLLLPHVDRILSRGALTHACLAEMGVTNVERADDLAFTLPHDQNLPDDVETVFERLGGNGVVAVMPSAVVESWCDRHDIDHAGVFASMIQRMCDELGVGVVLLPHAYRASGTPRRMDDARVCRTVAERLGRRDDVAVIDRDLTPGELRTIVDRSDMLVASRFHGMITGLATATPTLIVGWGHKYSEVLAEFDSEESAFDYSALRTPDEIVDRLVAMWTSRVELSRRLREALGPVIESAMRNFDVLNEVGGRTR